MLVGTDIGSRLSFALYAQGGNAKASPDYGAFGLYSGGADLRVAVLGRKDRNDWERFYVYVHGRAGYAKSYPEGLFATSDFVVAAGPGVEYYTRLRHFSVGLAADYVRATQAGANGYQIYPSVRYTF